MVTTQDPESDEGERAPISVDFAAIRAVNEDVLGWIYCPDTAINYPVLQGTDNDQYLHHTYDGSYAYSGSIFVEATNSRDLLDSNTIIYGHHMRNGSMFGGLDQWEEQDYYEEHPIIWLLTPEQDYKIEILSAYTTSGYSVETYTIFRGPCLELDEYLETNMAKSVIDTGVQPEEGARYVLLSTCSRDFEDARFVIHGKLVPVESAGGTPIN